MSARPKPTDLPCLQTSEPSLQGVTTPGVAISSPSSSPQPTRKAKMPFVRILSQSEISRLYLALDPATKPVFELLFLIGTSPEELETLSDNDFDCPRQELFVEGQGLNLNRFLFLSKRIAQMLKVLSAVNPSARFIDTLTGRRLPAVEVTADILAAVDRCQFEGVQIEDLRWTLGSWMIDAGADPYVVAAYLGTDPRRLSRRVPQKLAPVPPPQNTPSNTQKRIRKRRVPAKPIEEVIEVVSTKLPKFSLPM